MITQYQSKRNGASDASCRAALDTWTRRFESKATFHDSWVLPHFRCTLVPQISFIRLVTEPLAVIPLPEELG